MVAQAIAGLDGRLSGLDPHMHMKTKGELPAQGLLE